MPRHRLLHLAAWLVALGAGAILLTGSADALPPVSASLTDMQRSYDRDGIALLSLAILRPLALAAVGYQFVVALVTFVAAITSSATLLHLTRRAPGSITRSIVRHAVGAGLTATAVTSLAPTMAFAQSTATEIDPSSATTQTTTANEAPLPTASTIGEPIMMVRLPAADRSAGGDEVGDSPQSGTAVMVALDPGSDRPPLPAESNGPSDSTTNHNPTDHSAPEHSTTEHSESNDGASTAPSGTTSPRASAPSTLNTSSPHPGEGAHTADGAALADEAAPDPAVDEGGAETSGETESDATSDTWQIEAGDHLWAVAAETLADEWGHAPSDDDVLHYWDALLHANLDRLIDPANPDLVFPGQVLVLPPVPAGDPSGTSGG